PGKCPAPALQCFRWQRFRPDAYGWRRGSTRGRGLLPSAQRTDRSPQFSCPLWPVGCVRKNRAACPTPAAVLQRVSVAVGALHSRCAGRGRRTCCRRSVVGDVRRVTHGRRSVERDDDVGVLVANRLEESGQLKHRLAVAGVDAIRQVAELIVETLASDHKLLLFGNGGSAADAQHLAAEFVGRYSRDRRPLAAIALTTDSSVLTAISNDYTYQEIFARQVR